MDNYIDHHNDSQKSFKNIFSYILKKGKTTRREIQKDTAYSWSSVSSVVSVLINKDLVIETESIHHKVGRGTSFIVPNGNKYVSIGVDMNSVGFSLLVIGIDGSKKYEQRFPYEINNSKDYTLKLLLDTIKEGIEFAKEKYKVISIGISCQGHVINNSILEKFPFCEGLENLNIKELVENKFGIYTYAQHDTNCVLEDYFTNYDSDINNHVCIFRIVSGIGFAINVNGQILEEKLGPVDFGHMIVQPNGDLCSCGKKGCLEAYASTTGICKRAGVNDFSIIDSNRNKYRKTLDEAAYFLGITCANMIRIFDVQKIVLTGIVVGKDDILFNKIKEVYKEYDPSEIAQIICLDNLSPAYGAARLAFREKNNLEVNFCE